MAFHFCRLLDFSLLYLPCLELSRHKLGHPNILLISYPVAGLVVGQLLHRAVEVVAALPL